MVKKKGVCLIFVTEHRGLQKQPLPKVIPELSLLAKTDLAYVDYDSQGNLATQWQALVALLQGKAKEGYGGLVVVCDLSLILYLSNVVSFGWLKPTVPIIFTVGLENLFLQKELLKPGGAKANLINAVQLGTLAKNQTVILDGYHLIAPSRAIFDPFANYQSLASADGQYIGKVDFGISFSEEALPLVEAWPHHNRFETNIQIADESLGKKFQLDKSAQGLIVVRREPMTGFEPPVAADIPQVVFQSGLGLKTAEPIINYLTWHCLMVKFAWLLAATQNQTLITNGLANPYVGEIIDR